MKICVMVFAPQKGLLASLGKELIARGHDVVFALRDIGVESVVRKLLPDMDYSSIAIINQYAYPPINDLNSEILNRELEYKETFAMIAAHDRGLGKGYLFNVQWHPEIIRAWWPTDAKYSKILNDFICYEAVLDKLRPELVLGVGIPKAAHVVCRARGIEVRILTPPRFGSLYRWTTNEYEECPELSKALMQRVAEFSETDNWPVTVLEQTTFAQHFFLNYKYDYVAAVKKVLRQIFVETYQLLRRTHKSFKDGYRYLGWCWPTFYKPYIYRYLKLKGRTPDDFAGKKVVLFPLHMEPEASLLNLSPEMNNSMEIITWISKSLPADAVLVVKEHPDTFGLRPRSYYDNFLKMANVTLAHPETHGQEWLSCCHLLATITSTMGFEAVAMEKPVLSFGAHQVINYLPTVVFADSFNSTKIAVQKLLASSDELSRKLKISRVALDFAFRDACFDLTGYERTIKSNELHMDMARRALSGLQATDLS